MLSKGLEAKHAASVRPADQLPRACHDTAGLPLEHLDLRACVRLTDACLSALASQCGHLKRLHLDNCAQLTTAGIVKVCGMLHCCSARLLHACSMDGLPAQCNVSR